MPAASARTQLARKVRDLRLARRWTQAELAGKLGLSQNRLSEIERGGGSFTAEQFLEILRLFNVTTDHFAGSTSTDDSLQNALARLGAQHLVERDDVLPSERLQEVEAVIREVLVEPEWPRHITSLAPVLVKNIDNVPLHKLALTLSTLGISHRLGWVAENTLEAIAEDVAHADKTLLGQYRRAQVVLASFVEHARAAREPARDLGALDFLDRTIRSAKSRVEVQNEASTISRAWGIVSAIQVSDFSEALRGARVAAR